MYSRNLPSSISEQEKIEFQFFWVWISCITSSIVSTMLITILGIVFFISKKTMKYNSSGFTIANIQN